MTMVITGSSGGVGRACVEALGRAGHRVLGLDLAPPASRVEGADFYVEDVRNLDRFGERLSAEVLLGGFIACAALPPDHENPQAVIETNFTAPVEQAFLFIERAPAGASVLLLSSIAAFRLSYQADGRELGGRPDVRAFVENALRNNPVTNGYEAYCLSKRLLYACVPDLARQAAERGVRVNCLLLGPTQSPLAEALRLNQPARWETLMAECPLGGPVPMSEVTHAVSFLVSPMMAHLTGTTILLDGGWSALRSAIPRQPDA